jgi:penicillin V acylase-like amidase (Ntn superfamily)
MCSGIRIICRDGKVIVARTLEFGFIFDYTLYYDANILGIVAENYFLDGINKDGLSVMTFYFPHFDEYTNDIPEGNISLMSLDVTGYLLKHAKNINDVTNLIKKITVNKEIFKTMGIVVPVHWFCVDKSGHSIIIESVDGVLTAYENKLGISTNSPTFPTHLLSLEAYPEFSRYNNVKKNYSEGTGMNGLPGDFTSISRFVRLNLFQQIHDKPVNSTEGIATAFHILNNFDIVKGYVENSKGVKEFTQYTVVYNLNGFNGWYKTYENVVVRNLISKKILVFNNKNNENNDNSFISLNNSSYSNVYLLIMFIILVLIIIIILILNKKNKIVSKIYKYVLKSI